MIVGWWALWLGGLLACGIIEVVTQISARLWPPRDTAWVQRQREGQQ